MHLKERKGSKWIENDGRVRDYCGKTCAMKAGALLKDTGTISRLNPQTISLPNPQPIQLVDSGASPIQSRARKLEKEILEMESDVEADVDSDVVVLDVGAVGVRVGSRGQPGLEDFLNSPSPFKT
jgi:hypothetical protein